MKYIILVLIIFLTTCSNHNVRNVKKNNFIFLENLNFNHNKIKLLEYSKNNSYPDIDE